MEEIQYTLRGMKLGGQISSGAIRAAIMSYRPEAHAEHQPETPEQGVRRILSWMAHLDSPRNPAGFLIKMAKKGMDKPAALIRTEQEKEAEKQEQERRRQERERLEALKAEREIPPESRKFLDQFIRAAV